MCHKWACLNGTGKPVTVPYLEARRILDQINRSGIMWEGTLLLSCFHGGLTEETWSLAAHALIVVGLLCFLLRTVARPVAKKPGECGGRR